MIASNNRFLYFMPFYIVMGLFGIPIETTEVSPAETPPPTSALARCHLRYAKDNTPQHECTIQIKELDNTLIKCSTKNGNPGAEILDSEDEIVATRSNLLCRLLMQHLYLLSCGTFPSRLDTGLDRDENKPLYVHPRSGQSIDFVLHFDPSAPDYAHECGGTGCSFEESNNEN